MSYIIKGFLPNGDGFGFEGVNHVSLVDAETHGPAPKLATLANGEKVVYMSGANVSVAEVEKVAA